MARYTDWISMSVLPDYDGHYDVEIDGLAADAEYILGKWSKEGATRWRGRPTRLRKADAEKLKAALAKHLDSPAYRDEAAQAALLLARAAQERAARTGKHAALKTACRFFHIAAGLNAPMQARDDEFMANWWTRFKPAPKRKVEAEVAAFLSDKPVRVS
ncbi:hypothetical protein [Paraburkholderia xenovorans]